MGLDQVNELKVLDTELAKDSLMGARRARRGHR
jgi:hypothetical protein